MPKPPSTPATITGLQAFRGEGAPAAKGFWADAWEHVLKQPAALVGLAWVLVVAFFAVFAPLISSGHPLVMWEIDRRTAEDAASWFAQELSSDRSAQDGSGGARLRAGATVAAARSTLRRELSRHHGAPPVSSYLSDEIAGDTPLGVSEFARIVEALRTTAALDTTGKELRATSPLLKHLRASDWTILLGGLVGIPLLLAPRRWAGGTSRGSRATALLVAGVQATLSVVLAVALSAYFTQRDAPDWARSMQGRGWFVPAAACVCAAVSGGLFVLVPSIRSLRARAGVTVGVAAVMALVLGLTWRTPPGSFDSMERERRGEIRAVYTLIPWSPNQRPADRDAAFLAPGKTHDQALANIVRSVIPPLGVRESTARDVEQAAAAARRLPLPSEIRDGLAREIEERFGGQTGVSPTAVHRVVDARLAGVGRVHLLGTDKFGQDVLAQLLHACRLAISMGLVATGLATVIGVTMGSLMGYFGGWVDMVLYRVVEMFMAIPVLFLLIVAAGVLPRNTYVMMAIIGCVTWHGAARFTRAEFLRLRSQDFVQSARAVGLPLRSILFRHMLPNGVTPVLVDASFGIAAAILFEAVLSYLGLGPPDQPSWGRVLSDAAGEAGTFNWWLGVFPGGAIFLTVLSLTMVGESLRDAIDPKLKKARV